MRISIHFVVSKNKRIQSEERKQKLLKKGQSSDLWLTQSKERKKSIIHHKFASKHAYLRIMSGRRNVYYFLFFIFFLLKRKQPLSETTQLIITSQTMKLFLSFSILKAQSPMQKKKKIVFASNKKKQCACYYQQVIPFAALW